MMAIDYLREEYENMTEMEQNTIKIKYFTDITPIEMKPNGDWIDLRSAEDLDLKQGQAKIIHLGVAMKLPKGYEAHIVPRSSTYKNFGVIQLNHIGIIDESYCGNDDEWCFSAYALRDTHISKDDRICQFRIIKKQPQIKFDIVNKLNDKNRGGFGSSGIK